MAVIFGIELVVATLGGRPGWKGTPDARPRLLVPFLVGDRLLLIVLTNCGDVIAERMSPPLMGISPEVGVRKERSGELDEVVCFVGESFPRRRS